MIFNEGNVDPDDDRLGVIFGTLDPPQFDRPVIGTTFAAGRDLYSLLQSGADVGVNLSVTARVVPTQSANVIADTVGGRADRTVVVGAHLDSVDAGPGINDNGSGSAMLLDLAKRMSNLHITPTNKVRFAWWGGEEFGLLGAEHYVSTLPKAELKNIALNLNFDMVASPNVRFVYDGDGSATDTRARAVRARSSRRSSTTSCRKVSRPSRPRSRTLRLRAVHRPRDPAGGLFTGAEGIKTAAEAATYGGTAGLAYDQCYHQLCDQWPATST